MGGSEVASVADAARNCLFNFPGLFPMACGNPPVRYQFHWQRRDDYRQTVLVAESGPITSFDGAEAWLESLRGRMHECPEGSMPMVCDQGSEYFVRAA